MTRNVFARFVLLLLFCCSLAATPSPAQVTIAQISDPHIGLARAPEGSDNLRKAVQLINQRNPDVVVVSGDIAERRSGWEEAQSILKGLKVKVHFIPGNHDMHSEGPAKFRRFFGDDYYRLNVKNVTIYALNSQLLGNWDKFDARPMPEAPPEVQAEAQEMLKWLNSQDAGQGAEGKGKAKGRDRIVMAMQHVPPVRDGDFPNDTKPYWTVPEPWRSREIDALKKLGVRDVLVGHWHYGRVFNADGLTWRVAPSTSWSPFGGKLGFAMHTVSAGGDVSTEFVYLDGTTERAR